jgi:hypothetical protein
VNFPNFLVSPVGLTCPHPNNFGRRVQVVKMFHSLISLFCSERRSVQVFSIFLQRAGKSYSVKDSPFPHRPPRVVCFWLYFMNPSNKAPIHDRFLWYYATVYQLLRVFIVFGVDWNCRMECMTEASGENYPTSKPRKYRTVCGLAIKSRVRFYVCTVYAVCGRLSVTL